MATPGGSVTLAKLFDVSSATIRAEMARLEELGLVASPHTSAGRIPTDAGYRLYVNSLVSRENDLDLALESEDSRIISAFRTSPSSSIISNHGFARHVQANRSISSSAAKTQSVKTLMSLSLSANSALHIPTPATLASSVRLAKTTLRSWDLFVTPANILKVCIKERKL